MIELFEKYGIILDENMEEKFKIFREMLKNYNKMFNLTSITDDEEIVIKHFIDSVKGVDKFSTNANVFEVGSGGGFPSLPLKIIRDDLKFTLLEATGKKCEFLNAVINKLGLKNMNVINGRAEDFGKNELYRENYDYCVARAVARLNTLCEYCIPFIKKGGKFIAYKGECGEEIKEAENAVKILGCRINGVDEFDLPEAGKRSIVEIEKITSTPFKYPRGNGKEKNKPL